MGNMLVNSLYTSLVSGMFLDRLCCWAYCVFWMFFQMDLSVLV